jgi:hypothetical protein
VISPAVATREETDARGSLQISVVLKGFSSRIGFHEYPCGKNIIEYADNIRT